MAEQKKVPVVRARNRGQITTVLERFRAAYRAGNPGRVTRYVYHPEHKPELSQVLSREASGYKKVLYKDLGLSLDGVKPDDVVRVADLILMSIDEASARQLVGANQQAAENQLTTVHQKHYQDIEQLGDAHRKKEHSRPGVAPVGSATIATQDFAYDIEQRTGEEG